MAPAPTHETEECRIAGALAIVGQRWTLLIVREALRGTRRFTDFGKRIGVAPNILQQRLEFLIDMDIVERRQYQDHPLRYEYDLTDKGRDLWPVIAALMRWGDAHLEWSGGPPVGMTHNGCGGTIETTHRCGACDAELSSPQIGLADRPRTETVPTSS